MRRLLERNPLSPPALLFLSWDRIGWCANLDVRTRDEALATSGHRAVHRAVLLL